MTVLRDIHGPCWPIGFIEVVLPGTPVKLTSLIDPADTDAPGTPTAAGSLEYTTRFNQILFQGMRPSKISGMVPNLRNVYIVRAGGNRDDYGTIVLVVAPGQTVVLSAAPTTKDVFSLYRYWVDGDQDNDGVLVLGLIF
jgi:hypothetical protein